MADSRRPIDLEELLERLYMLPGKPIPSGGWCPVAVDDPLWDQIEDQTGVSVSPSWRRVVEAIWGCPEHEATLFFIDQCVLRHNDIEAGLKWQKNAEAGKYLHVASDACGDWFSLVEGGEKGVVRFDHETSVIVRRWNTVAEFVAEMMIRPGR